MTTWKDRRDALRAARETPAVRAAILTGLADSNRRVRQDAIAAAAARLDDPEIRAALQRGLADRSLVIRRLLAPLSGDLGLEVAGALLSQCERESGEKLLIAGEGLAGLAERFPDPALRQAAATLRRRARRWFLSPVQRNQLNGYARRIDAATEHVKDLPRGASAPLLPRSLPRPALEPQMEKESLPIPGDASRSESRTSWLSWMMARLFNR